jgi:hypothetical protein
VNIFILIGQASKALKRAGKRELVAELMKEVEASGDYEKAKAICYRYMALAADAKGDAQ